MPRVCEASAQQQLRRAERSLLLAAMLHTVLSCPPWGSALIHTLTCLVARPGARETPPLPLPQPSALLRGPQTRP